MRPERVLAASSWTSSFLSLSSCTMSCCTALAFSGDSRNMWRNQKTCIHMSEHEHALDESADKNSLHYDSANFSLDHMFSNKRCFLMALTQGSSAVLPEECHR